MLATPILSGARSCKLVSSAGAESGRCRGASIAGCARQSARVRPKTVRPPITERSSATVR
eukprot:9812668-Lingulodinium_polyedra.AAC.1